MNTPVTTHVQKFTKKHGTQRAVAMKLALGCLAVVIFAGSAQAEWAVDFSRRARASREADLHAAGQVDRAPASLATGEAASAVSEAPSASVAKGVFDTLFDGGEPVQEIVVLNTEKGFVPSTVRVRKNGRYKIHVVNVNEKEKNVSFILDGFSEHHATYYGKIKTFFLEPKKEGVFSFQSPETAMEGRLVVFNPQITVRNPASEDGK